MNAQQLPIAIIGFLGIVALVPAWMFFTAEYTGSMPTGTAWIARFSLPAVALLFVGSWLGGDL